MNKTFVREHYPWGRTPTYRLEDGTLEFHFGCGEDYVVARGWQEMKPIILDRWMPVGYEDEATYRRIKAGGWD